MKTLSLLGFVGLMASVLAGCPIFSGDDGNSGTGTQVCVGDGCCSQPADCLQNETCGSDGQCHPGDCESTPCLSGYTCVVDTNTDTASCVPGTSGSGGAGTGGTGTGATGTGATGGTGGKGTGGTTTTTGTGGTTTTTTGTGGTTTSTPVYCGHPSDCPAGEICGAAGTCQPGPCSTTNACIYGYTCAADGTCKGTANACDTDATCTGGDLCIAGSDGKGGECTSATNQCFDQSQCGAGENCVAGKCTLGCTTNTDCRDGFTCNTTTGVCSGIAQTCTVTNDCGSATLVCVGGACVPRSGPNGTCTNPGDVWDENGCVPNQGATFTCANDGVKDACATGSICLHHDCWISCDAPNQSACSTQPTLDACKPVADNGSTYNVCGTSSNLGNQCGAGSTGNQTCTGAAVCIDGFCK